MCDSLESYVTWFDQDNTLERDVNGCDQNHSLKSDLGHRLLVVVMSRLISESSISWFDQDNTLERDVNGCDQNHSLSRQTKDKQITSDCHVYINLREFY